MTVSDPVASEPRFRLELTPAELKLTNTALRSLLGDLRHEHHDLRQIVRDVLAKLPPAEEIERIDLPPRR